MNTVPIEGYEGRYSVTENGKIFSHLSEQFLVPTRRANDYLRVSLRDISGNAKDFWVHRLVCTAFHGSAPYEKACVNHINCDKSDNTPENLEWCTHRQNMTHASENGLLFHQSVHMQNVNKLRRIAIEGCDKNGNVIVTFPSIESARMAGYSAISHCLKKGNMQKSGGLYWRQCENQPSHTDGGKRN